MARQYQNIIDKMSLEEKAGLLSGGEAFKTRPYTKLGVPSLQFSDGPHGLRKQEEGANHLGIGGSVRATCFPTAATIANSWDPSLAQKLGETLQVEAQVQHVNVMLGPGMNIKRNPLCGRNFEYFSEDPYLAGKMAAGYVRGMQRDGLSACPKHFAVNSQELCRMSSDSIVDERTLREIYLTGFEIAVTESKPKTIMTSYNRINGTYANENPHLLDDILKKEWGYKGAVVTDWGGSNDHVEGVRCGSDFEMPSPGCDPIVQLVKAVRAGKISEEIVNDRVEEALELILSTDEVMKNAPKSFDEEAHHQVAREAALESIVLLRNEDNILPLLEGTKVAVIGDFAQTPRYQGAGSSLVNPTKLDTILSALPQSGLVSAGFAQGYKRNGGDDDALKQEAVDLAGKADAVLYVCGLDEIKESEGLDRDNMKINQNQIDVLHAVARANPNVIVLLCSGSSIEMPWISDTKAVVYCCLGGQAGAGAALDVVTGRYNPSGKLSETYAMRYEDVPSFKYYPGRGKTSEYREGIYVGYRYYDTAKVPVRFPFGYGLSYTTYEYNNMKISDDGIDIDITNTGDRDGAEIVQMYVSKPESVIFRPVKELKGFSKVFLKASETKTVHIPFDDKTFRYFDVKENRWRVEAGEYIVRVGANCEDIRAEKSVIINAGTAVPVNPVAPKDSDPKLAEVVTDPYAGKNVAAYREVRVTDVPDTDFAALLGHDIPDQKVVIDRNITFNQLIHGRSPIFWLVWLVLTLMKRAADKSGKPNLNLLFIYNMPLRGLQKNAGGIFSMGMVDSFVMEVKGFWIIGIVRFIFEFIKYLFVNASMNKKLSVNK